MALTRSKVVTLLGSAALAVLFVLAPGHAMAAGMDGAQLSLPWVIPFVCMLLSIAICPLTVPHFWEHNFGKIAAGWGLAFLIPCAVAFGFSTALEQFLHAIVAEYIPFIILLLSLFTVAGGIRLKGTLVGTPAVNTLLLFIGAVLASWMGTTGAAMLLIRPMLRANAHRKYKVHSVVFFIFLVANIGGCLTPLGDPPLFLGFLKGVPFFWTLTHLWVEWLFAGAILLALYFVLDTVLYGKEGKPVPQTQSNEKLGLDGSVNFILLACIVAAVLVSGVWNPGAEFHIYGHVTYALQGLCRDIFLLLVAFVSWKITSQECRKLNGFSWFPIMEVAKIFFGIFVSMIPAISILQAGTKGALAGVINMVSNPDGTPINSMYFWLTGGLSSFLDNAPTYVVFFNAAGGDPGVLTTSMASTLAAVSLGAVFMGANTYIGNAPNFMVRSIAEDQGVAMPSFFGYMMWSVGILVPLFIVTTLIFM
ncbi:Citrate transporter [uncultured delta proteobacterium]|uniref:Citrate transporter n=1 Tax=uncultured delta proteobacterium TaxID=34034 RepID=A0A212JAI5_9DELT|nr:Citrate transporter [uncultured delta proteobacterium]